MHNFIFISHKIWAVVDNKHLINLEVSVQQNPANDRGLLENAN
jgi:hypothetical protein